MLYGDFFPAMWVSLPKGTGSFPVLWHELNVKLCPPVQYNKTKFVEVPILFCVGLRYIMRVIQHNSTQK